MNNRRKQTEPIEAKGVPSITLQFYSQIRVQPCLLLHRTPFTDVVTLRWPRRGRYQGPDIELRKSSCFFVKTAHLARAAVIPHLRFPGHQDNRAQFNFHRFTFFSFNPTLQTGEARHTTSAHPGRYGGGEKGGLEAPRSPAAAFLLYHLQSWVSMLEFVSLLGVVRPGCKFPQAGSDPPLSLSSSQTCSVLRSSLLLRFFATGKGHPSCV